MSLESWKIFQMQGKIYEKRIHVIFQFLNSKYK